MSASDHKPGCGLDTDSHAHCKGCGTPIAPGTDICLTCPMPGEPTPPPHDPTRYAEYRQHGAGWKDPSKGYGGY